MCIAVIPLAGVSPGDILKHGIERARARNRKSAPDRERDRSGERENRCYLTGSRRGNGDAIEADIGDVLQSRKCRYSEGDAGKAACIALDDNLIPGDHGEDRVGLTTVGKVEKRFVHHARREWQPSGSCNHCLVGSRIVRSSGECTSGLNVDTDFDPIREGGRNRCSNVLRSPEIEGNGCGKRRR